MKTKILEAIKLIATGYDGEVSYRVEPVVEKNLFQKQAIKKTIIHIELVEKI
ncbi:MAG: hypothetical protein IMZ64_07450 [Bacteroidetes bacterium]|nr:hypothetical protein [Bacteroidota bacterium]